MKIEEAKGKLCPMRCSYQKVRECAETDGEEEDVIIYRPSPHFCKADRCMLWRPTPILGSEDEFGNMSYEKNDGYCGLGGM